MERRVYLDNSATTKICREALDKYIEASESCFGNPSSLHKMGLEAEKLVNAARGEILKSLSARGYSVVFTASGSEANNLALLGRAYAKDRYRKGKKIITTDGEHASIDEPLSRLAKEGYKIVKIPTLGGELDIERLKAELDESVILVTVMAVNNETGAIYDIATVNKYMRMLAPEALLHVDATQSYMKLQHSLSSLPIDMITVSSHKIEGPKGVGALVVNDKVLSQRGLSPLILGGGQEGGLRSGTENVPAVAAFGEAVRVYSQSRCERYNAVLELSEYLISEIGEKLPEISITLPKRRAAHILNITLPKIKSETMLHFLSSIGIFVSSGSACSSNDAHLSSALTAFGRSAEEADSSLRISLSYRNAREDIDALISGLSDGLKKLQRIK
jgi:cysteine desulfurase